MQWESVCKSVHTLVLNDAGTVVYQLVTTVQLTSCLNMWHLELVAGGGLNNSMLDNGEIGVRDVHVGHRPLLQ